MKLRFLILMLAVCLLFVCASAEEFVIDLPDKLTVIGEEAFMGDTSIGKVIMPEGMYWVGERAFADSSISGLEIPEGTQIYFQNNTFDGIQEDTEFYIQGIREGYIHTPGDQFEVEQLATGAYAVTGYKGTSAYVRIPHMINGNTITEIGSQCFSSSDVIVEVYLPGTIDTVGAMAFLNCEKLEKIDLADGLTGIGLRAFSGCSALKRVELPECITALAGYSFENCTALEEVVVPDDAEMTLLGEAVFRGCSGLKRFNVPSGVTELRQELFCDCTALETVVIPSGVTTVGSYVFEDCVSLKAVSLPSTLKTISDYAFLRSGPIETLAIPSSAEYIGIQAFKNSRVRSISIPGNAKLQVIGEAAFSVCDSLVSVVLPPSMVTIGKAAFELCDSLQTVDFHSISSCSMDTIGRYAFSSCPALATVKLPVVSDCANDIFWSSPNVTVWCKLGSAVATQFGSCSDIKAFRTY